MKKEGRMLKNEIKRLEKLQNQALRGQRWAYEYDLKSADIQSLLKHFETYEKSSGVRTLCYNIRSNLREMGKYEKYNKKKINITPDTNIIESWRSGGREIEESLSDLITTQQMQDSQKIHTKDWQKNVISVKWHSIPSKAKKRTSSLDTKVRKDG